MKKKRPGKADTVEKLAGHLEHSFIGLTRQITELRTDIAQKIEYVREEMINQFDHFDESFRLLRDDIRDVRMELADIQRRLAGAEDRGDTQSGFAKEIDTALSRIASLEKRLQKLERR